MGGLGKEDVGSTLGGIGRSRIGKLSGGGAGGGNGAVTEVIADLPPGEGGTHSKKGQEKCRELR